MVCQAPPTRSNGVLTGGFGFLNYTGITANSVSSCCSAALQVPATSPPQIQFEEIAAKSSLHFQFHNAASRQCHQIELTGGVAVLDCFSCWGVSTALNIGSGRH